MTTLSPMHVLLIIVRILACGHNLPAEINLSFRSVPKQASEKTAGAIAAVAAASVMTTAVAAAMVPFAIPATP